MKKMSEEVNYLENLRARLRALLERKVETSEDADLVAEAARLLRDLMRLDEQAGALLARAEGGTPVRERALPYRSGGFEGLPLHEAARRALEAAGEPLHVRDLGARIKAGGWRHPRATRPNPDQIEFQLAARLPRHPHTFRRVAPNTFGLVERDDTAPRARATPRFARVRGRGPTLARTIGEEPDLIHGEEPRWRSS